MVWEKMSFEEFQDGHLRYLNGRILTILNLCVTVMLPIKFWLNPAYGLEEMSFEEFHDGFQWRPPWISERYNLTILNLYVAPMPPIKFWLNPTYNLGGDVV